MLEKTIIGTEFGVMGFTNFNHQVTDFINQIEGRGYKVIDKTYFPNPCGCSESCKVVRHKAVIIYSEGNFLRRKKPLKVRE